MSLQRRINRNASSHRLLARRVPSNVFVEDEIKPDKGQKNGSCNRRACQAPLADEPEHQFMEGNLTGGPRLYYCGRCARDFDDWDHRSGDRIRITRELKCEEAP